MCGIAGYVGHNAAARPLAPLVEGLRLLGHRGPDDEGLTAIDRSTGRTLDWSTDHSAPGVPLRPIGADEAPVHDIAFGHRRFSIVDLTVRGHQPMWTGDGTVCVSVNGEIYNHAAIRRELEGLGRTFCSTSDTEVLIVAYQQWGTDCFSRFNGFWALSLYDAERDQVLLARDRLGKAPLYYTVAQDGVYWASEVGVVRALAPTRFTIRDQSVVDFVARQRRDYDHTTFFSEIHTLPSGTFAWIGEGGHLRQHRYWELPADRLTEADITVPEATAELRSLLLDATNLRLQADVPAAVQVSGGLDSSAVMALAAQAAPSVSAFTVRFPGSSVDEEPYARMVAERYRSTVDYNVFEPPDEDLLDNLDFFIGLMGEPFHQPNQYTARGIWQVIAGRGYKVNLYGSGGDEVFAGYSPLYFYPYVRKLVMAGRLKQARHELASLTDRRPGPLGVDYPLRALRTLPHGRELTESARGLRLRGKDPFVMPNGYRPRPGPNEQIDRRLIDLVDHELLNYWLRIDSQNAMSIPLELRAPLLDYRVVDFAFSLPLGYLMRDGWMKWILRKAIDEDLPPEITWRRVKAGFPFPLGEWLSRHERRFMTQLSDIACPYIDTEKLALHWQANATHDPVRLWSVISVGLWWKKVVQGEALV